MAGGWRSQPLSRISLLDWIQTWIVMNEGSLGPQTLPLSGKLSVLNLVPLWRRLYVVGLQILDVLMMFSFNVNQIMSDVIKVFLPV